MYNSADGKRYLFIDQSDSLTWHRPKRRTISDSPNVIDHHVLKILSNSIISRYSTLMLHFLISCILHAAIDIASVMPWLKLWSDQDIFTEILGIAVEDQLLQNRSLGYFWLTMSSSWSTPTRLYSTLDQTRGDTQESVFRLVLGASIGIN